MPSVTVILPVYRDADALSRTLAATSFAGSRVVVVSTPEDDSVAPLRAARPDLVWIEAPRGRGRQMNAAAAIADSRWLLFLHADTQLPQGWAAEVAAADRDPRVAAGCFRFALDSRAAIARLIELGVRLRVALFALPYGDQAIFVRRDAFAKIGGYADLPIMEDVDLIRRLRRVGGLYRAPRAAVTSARRWERDGWIARTLRHLTLITLYFCGVPPSRLISLDRARRAHPVAGGNRMSL